MSLVIAIDGPSGSGKSSLSKRLAALYGEESRLHLHSNATGGAIHVGVFTRDIDKALRLIETIGRSNVRLQLDLYHAQIIQGDLARSIEENIAQIGHVQIADNPGRHEPGTGEINYPFLFSLLDRLGYAGWVGCEYKPLTTTEAGLGWLPK